MHVILQEKEMQLKQHLEANVYTLKMDIIVNMKYWKFMG